MTKAIQFILYKNHYLLVDFTIDLNMTVKLLVEDNIFEFEIVRGIKETEFVGFFIGELAKIRLEALLKKY